MDRPGRKHPYLRRPNHLPAVSALDDLSHPTNLIEQAPRPGEAPVVICRDPGWAIKVWRPELSLPDDQSTPPGQGQLLIPLRGDAEIKELGGPESRVVSTDRPDASTKLTHQQLFRVANDARWAVREASVGAILLAISTSVPRQAQRTSDLRRQASGGLSTSPQLVFSNESLRLEVLAARGRLPFRGFTPLPRRPATDEVVIVVAGALDIQLGSKATGKRQRLKAGSLWRLPAGLPRRIGASDGKEALALILSPGRVLQRDGAVDRTGRRDFTPFAPN